MMDNAIDISKFPLPAQAQEANAKRRIGLGVTGLADALIMCGVRYGSPESIVLIERWMKALRDHAYRASTELAAEKGAFPLYDKQEISKTDMVRSLDPGLQKLIAKNGLRNALLTSIAPTGTISPVGGQYIERRGTRVRSRLQKDRAPARRDVPRGRCGRLRLEKPSTG